MYRRGDTCKYVIELVQKQQLTLNTVVVLKVECKANTSVEAKVQLITDQVFEKLHQNKYENNFIKSYEMSSSNTWIFLYSRLIEIYKIRLNFQT